MPTNNSTAIADLIRHNYEAFYLAINPGYDRLWYQSDILSPALQQVASGDTKRLVVYLPPRHGKLLANSTPVLTANRGWTTHGQLNIGDAVFGLDGQPIEVIGISSAPGVADYELKTTTGATIYAHAQHEWRVFDQSTQAWRVVSTEYLATKRLWSNGCRVIQLPPSPCLHFPIAELPIQPYALGVWLGNGATGFGEDFKSLEPKLEALQVLGNKHIPKQYKFSSVSQRLELLAGLVDADGLLETNIGHGRVRIYTRSLALCNDIVELLRSLGMRPCFTSTELIDGEQRTFTIAFQPNRSIPTHAHGKGIPAVAEDEHKVGVVSVKKCLVGEQGRCVEVNAKDGIYLVGKELIPTHNSQFITVGFVPWYLGHNPRHSVITLSYSDVLATGFGRQVRNIMQLPMYKKIFPSAALSPDSRAKDSFNTISGGRYTAAGFNGTITGIGANLLIIDDPVRSGVSATSEADEAVRRSIYSDTIRMRLEAGAAIILVMTRWPGSAFEGWLTEKDGWELFDPRRAAA